MFTELVSDLTQAVTGNDSPLTAALAQAVPTATVDTSAFVAPTAFTEAIIKVSTHAPTLSPTFNPTTKPTVSPPPSQTNRIPKSICTIQSRFHALLL